MDYWARLLKLSEHLAGDQHGLYGVLTGLHSMGAALEVGDGTLKLSPPIGVDRQTMRVWLLPFAPVLTDLLVRALEDRPEPAAADKIKLSEIGGK